MSNKKHKGNHGKRAEVRAAEKQRDIPQGSATAEKPRRVYLRNAGHIWGTLGIVIAVIAILIAFEVMGWWDNVIGAVLSVLVGAFGIMCAYDLALLLSACMSFGEGMVNAGKDERGQPIHFHAAAVVRLEMRDQADKPLPDDAPVYKNAEICFVMESGRINRRKVSRLSQKQLAAIRAALEAEKRFTD